MEDLKAIFDFANEVKSKLEKQYPKAEVNVNRITKNNDTTLVGVTIKEQNSNICPQIYVDDMYKDYISGKSTIDEIVVNIVSLHDTSIKNRENIHIKSQDLLNPEYIMENICLKLVNGSDANKEYLKDLLYVTKMDDLAAVFYIPISINDGEIASTNLKKSIFDTLNISVEELYARALRNTQNRFSSKMESMKNVICDMCPELVDEDSIIDEDYMYVLTNQQMLNGATVLLYPETMKQFCSKYNITCDCILIPSSIHEWIVLPKQEYTDVSDIAKMVNDVNTTVVGNTEILSFGVYSYINESDSVVKLM